MADCQSFPAMKDCVLQQQARLMLASLGCFVRYFSIACQVTNSKYWFWEVKLALSWSWLSGN